MHMAKLTNI